MTPSAAESPTALQDHAIAIVGMAARFPMARNLDEFWANLVAGKDCITRFSDDDLRATGYDPQRLRAIHGYVAARGLVEEAEWFDREFFGMGVREAEATDPQHRLFLELAWEALEDAGCDPQRFDGLIGVFSGIGNNTYHPFFIRQRRDLMAAAGVFTITVGNEKDFPATRLSYKLNLRGPSMGVQAACSTALVNVCIACQTLLHHQCDAAVVGSVSLTFPQRRGYFHQEGGMTASDGVCRPFSADATGTVFSNGAGVVVLKRLDEAVAAGDRIYAVIKGHALNNDGSEKVSYAAPSVTGQSEVIALAHAMAGVPPETISYIEAHGTATALGDPVEIAALTQAFRAATAAKQFCAVGSVKGNIGHCDAAAGMSGLIKTALCLHHKQIPPSIHAEPLNPALALEDSPFFINTTLRDWPAEAAPRRAGVTALGVGGTNAHLVLEEAPPQKVAPPRPGPQTLVLSARTPSALAEQAKRLAAHLEAHPDQALADVAWTLQTGRHVFPHRRAVVADSHRAAAAALRGAAAIAREDDRLDTPVALLCPGQGAQYPGMGAQLYAREPAFRAALDECAQWLAPELGLDLRTLLFATDDQSAALLQETRYTQPALFAMDYAVGRLWMALGIRPVALLGHSVGEFAAAALANVFSLADGARLIATRARLVQELPGGAMLAVRLSEQDAHACLDDPRVALAAANSPKLSVLSGPSDAIAALEERFKADGVPARRLATSHAFHSPMMDPVVAQLQAVMQTAVLRPPQIPIVSSVTGRWLTATEATDPQYWARHLRVTVRFADAVTQLFDERGCALLETGPGQTLTQLARQCPARTPRHSILSSLTEGVEENTALATAIGRLWVCGVQLDWPAVHDHQPRARVALPTYPFERQRYFADLPPDVPVPIATAATDGEPPVDLLAEDQTAALPAAQPVVAVAPVTAAVTKPAAPVPADRSVVAEESAQSDAVLAQLRQLLTDLSGIDLSAVPASTSLLELGFDSLFLAQAALALSRRFGCQIAFRHLIRELPTLEALAAHLAAHSAERKAPAQGAASAETAAAALTTPAPAGLPAAKPAAPVATAHGPFRPFQRGPAAALTASQQAWLDDFIARYVARTAGSKNYTQQHRAHFADPRAVAGFRPVWKEMVYPIVVNRSAGARLWDIDGNEWLDITLAFGAAMLGHQPPFVVEALKRQIEAGFEIGPTTPLAGEVARMLCEMTGHERALFCNTGSEAVLGALRVARAVTGRDKIVYFADSYHGIDNEVLGRRSVSGVVPIAPGIVPAAVSQALVLEYGHPAALQAIEQHAQELAAVLVEPVQSRHPDRQPREFLHALRTLTARHGIALIFDEVVNGFRCAPGGAQEFFGVRADLATYGKVVGGGLPIGIIAGSARFMNAFDGGLWQYGDESVPETAVTFFAGTFVRHPLAITAAHAVLTYLKTQGPGLQRTLTRRTEAMIAEINAALAGTPFRAVHFSSNWIIKTTPDFPFGSLLYALLRYRGIHVWENRPLFVSTAHSDADLARIVAALRDSVAELEQAGFFTRSTPLADNEIPVTESQREILLLCEGNPAASVAGTETWTLMLEGELDHAAFLQAVQTVVDRHDALRASFAGATRPMRIAPALTLEVPLVDLSGLDETTREQRFLAMRQAEGARRFDLNHAPLLALQLVKLAPDRHALLFNAHHVACDGWSCDIFLSELAELYSATREGRPHSLPDAMQMREYQRWEAALHQTPGFAAELDFWREKFRTIPPALELPGDRPYPATRSYRAASEQIVLPLEQVEVLTRFAARHGATFFTVMLAAFETLLLRLTGQEDLVVGIPAAGQNSVEGRNLIGHCVSVLPLRVRLDGAEPLAGLLQRLQGEVIEAFENQHVTFGLLLQKLAVPRLPGRIPLVAVTFNVDPPLGHIHFAGLRHWILTNPISAFPFDLGINCDTSQGALRIVCKFNADLLDAATTRRWLGHYRTLLETAPQHAQTPVGRWPIWQEFDPAIASDIHSTPYPRDATIAALFDEQARRSPDVIALDFPDGRLSYRELEAQANRLARFLQQQGVGPDTLVGVLLERSAAMVVAFLGILKAGGAYLPLDAAAPPARLAAILHDAQPVLTLTQHSLAGTLPADCRRVEIEAAAWAKESPTPPPSLATAESLAYVIFTSGSTGQPKGVAIPQRAVNRLVLHTDYIALRTDDVVAQASNAAFDAATFEIWGALLNGARLVGLSTTLPPRAFADALRQKGVTTLFLTTALFNQLAHTHPEGFRSLRTLLFGGETCDPAAVRAVLEHGAPERLLHVYGPTETTTFATWHLVREAGGRTVPIGRPIANTEVLLLDAQQQPVPIGAPGELFIGGDGLARGYLNDPALTAEKFVPHPFRPGERLYRTGDLGRRLADGTIEFVGRIDRQLKLRGFRIEPGEIEAVLGRHPGIGQRVVVARDSAAGKRLVAYAVPSNGAHLTPDAVRAFLKAELPAYMVPSAVVLLAALPVTPNGKIDLDQLPGPDATAPAGGQTVAPVTDTERCLVEIWEKLLNRRPVGIDDDFFELGGHSLLALQMVVEFEKRRGRTFPIGTLFKASTIRTLAAELDAATPGTAHGASTLVTMQGSGTRPPLFFVHAGDGGILFYRDLAALLGPDQPSYGIEAPWLTGRESPHGTIAAIATEYIQQIRSVRPHGPYLLAGFSFGGIAAYEMARQLREAGEEVPLLCLFDTSNPDDPPRRLTLAERVAVQRHALAGSRPGAGLRHLASRAVAKLAVMWLVQKERLDILAARALTGAGRPLPARLRKAQTRRRHLDAFAAYHPQAAPGGMLLFTAQTRNDGFAYKDDLGWGRLLGGQLRIVSVPGTHDTILLQPNVVHVAASLRVELERLAAKPVHA